MVFEFVYMITSEFVLQCDFFEYGVSIFDINFIIVQQIDGNKNIHLLVGYITETNRQQKWFFRIIFLLFRVNKTENWRRNTTTKSIQSAKDREVYPNGLHVIHVSLSLRFTGRQTIEW